MKVVKTPPPDTGCARCGWLLSDHGRDGSRFACRRYEAPASEYALQLEKAFAAVRAAR